MRLPGAALLIVIGLVVLWLATTGQLDRLATAWDYIKNNKPLPTTTNTNSAAPGGSSGSSIDPQGNILPPPTAVLDTPTYHVASLMNTLDSNTSMFQPGSMA